MSDAECSINDYIKMSAGDYAKEKIAEIRSRKELEIDRKYWSYTCPWAPIEVEVPEPGLWLVSGVDLVSAAVGHFDGKRWRIYDRPGLIEMEIEAWAPIPRKYTR